MSEILTYEDPSDVERVLQSDVDAAVDADAPAKTDDGRSKGTTLKELSEWAVEYARAQGKTYVVLSQASILANFHLSAVAFVALVAWTVVGSVAVTVAEVLLGLGIAGFSVAMVPLAFADLGLMYVVAFAWYVGVLLLGAVFVAAYLIAAIQWTIFSVRLGRTASWFRRDTLRMVSEEGAIGWYAVSLLLVLPQVAGLLLVLTVLLSPVGVVLFGLCHLLWLAAYAAGVYFTVLDKYRALDAEGVPHSRIVRALNYFSPGLCLGCEGAIVTVHLCLSLLACVVLVPLGVVLLVLVPPLGVAVLGVAVLLVCAPVLCFCLPVLLPIVAFFFIIMFAIIVIALFVS